MSSLRDAVRDKLREDKVKLWLPPYDDASKVDALAKTYAGVLEAPEPDVAAHLADLRQSALAKLAQRTLITLQGTNFSVRVSTELPGAVARAAVAQREVPVAGEDITGLEAAAPLVRGKGVRVKHVLRFRSTSYDAPQSFAVACRVGGPALLF